MSHHLAKATVVAALLGAVLLVPAGARGQDQASTKVVKGKGSKKGDGSDRAEGEEDRIAKAARKAFFSQTELDKWLKEMDQHYPGATAFDQHGEVDFGRWFGTLAGGRETWSRDAVRFKSIGNLFERAAERLGTGRGPISRGQFLAYAGHFLTRGNSPPWKPADPEAEADKSFRALDQDGSGFLEPGEWPGRLRAVAGRLDTDRDGRINPVEYLAYFEGRMLDMAGNDPEPRPEPPAPLRPPDRGPGTASVAAPPGKKPPEQPAWFRELDTDQDGQVGLYEWRKAGGRPSEEFTRLDLNGDGLLTPEEFARFVRSHPNTPYAANRLPPLTGSEPPATPQPGSLAARGPWTYRTGETGQAPRPPGPGSGRRR